MFQRREHFAKTYQVTPCSLNAFVQVKSPQQYFGSLIEGPH